jgi:hypothetical protein
MVLFAMGMVAGSDGVAWKRMADGNRFAERR